MREHATPEEDAADDPTNSDAGFVQKDKAAVSFLKVLDWMRTVFLQDAALLQDRCVNKCIK